MKTFVLLVWFVPGGFGGEAPARVDEYGTRAACVRAGEAWEAAGTGTEASSRTENDPYGTEHRAAARWVCLPGEK